MPKEKYTPLRKYVTVYLAETTISKLAILTLDPKTARARHGLKSQIVEKLLDKFFKAYQTKTPTIDVRDLITKLTNE